MPDFSEIYLAEDLIWNNNNQGVPFRSDILNIHTLSKESLRLLVNRIEESELDDYMPLVDFIGVAFDDVTPWGRCTIGELKGLIYLALGELESAKVQVDQFNHYNDNTPDRRRFYQVLEVVLDIYMNPDLKMEDYTKNLSLLYGEPLVNSAIASCEGSLKFYGLTPTDLKLTDIDKHQRLIKSYKKLQTARQKIEVIN